MLYKTYGKLKTGCSFIRISYSMFNLCRIQFWELVKVKIDKSDAKAICEYALINEVPIYNAMTDIQSECLQLFRLLDSYLKHRQRPQTNYMLKLYWGCIKICVSLLVT